MRKETTKLKGVKIMNIQKRWYRKTGFSTAYFVDLNNPILIFDSVANAFVKYEDLSFEDQNIVDIVEDKFEEASNQILEFGGKFYEKLNYNRFSLLREIKGIGETVYTLSDFKEV